MRLQTIAAVVLCFSRVVTAQPVHTVRVPDGGIQPQVATAEDGTLHLLYYKGDPKAGDLFYVKRRAGQPGFSPAVRVNSQPGSAVAVGNDRGGHLAVGKGGRVHVAWNGSSSAVPKGPLNPAMAPDHASNGLPMLYSRLNDKGDAFEPQRNVMTSAFGLDGGGSVAADAAGNVYVVFQADPAGANGKSETERRVFVACSRDSGATFEPEHAVADSTLGACSCCGLKAFVGPGNAVGVLFRSASTRMDRDAVFLSSHDSGETFASLPLQPWKIGACPMTTSAICRAGDGWALAWETKGNVFARVLTAGTGGDAAAKVLSPEQSESKRKYPAIAAGKDGNLLLVWTEGMAWSKGGSVAWQVFDATGKPLAGASGKAEGVPPWSLVAAFTEPDGSFTVLY